MKNLFVGLLTLSTFLAINSQAKACSEFALWIESPSMASQAESRALFNVIKSDVEIALTNKHFKLIPYGTYTRNVEKEEYCEINILVSRTSKLKKKALSANIKIEQMHFDMSEEIYSNDDELEKALKAIPDRKELKL
jgi:hypothetical protein